MEGVTEIGFEEALDLLCELVDDRVRILVSFQGTSGGLSLEGFLTRVETIPPDQSAVALFVDDRQSLMLDPSDTEVLAIEVGDETHVRFNLCSGVEADIEPARSASCLPASLN